MGRFAQRRRAGGGGTVQNRIVSAVLTAPTFCKLQYASNISISGLNASDFTSEPTNIDCNDVTQNGARGVVLEWDMAITGETGLTYSGARQDLVSPQTISY